MVAGFSAVIGASVLSAPALADAIDGDWCFGGHHMNIDGSTILTPARNKLQGQYLRYRFNYVIPANEPGAGGEINMVMIRGKEIVHLSRPGGKTGEPEVWHRCKPIS
jgi:hypothetical protein